MPLIRIYKKEGLTECEKCIFLKNNHVDINNEITKLETKVNMMPYQFDILLFRLIEHNSILIKNSILKEEENEERAAKAMALRSPDMIRYAVTVDRIHGRVERSYLENEWFDKDFTHWVSSSTPDGFVVDYIGIDLIKKNARPVDEAGNRASNKAGNIEIVYVLNDETVGFYERKRLALNIHFTISDSVEGIKIEDVFLGIKASFKKFGKTQNALIKDLKTVSLDNFEKHGYSVVWNSQDQYDQYTRKKAQNNIANSALNAYPGGAIHSLKRQIEASENVEEKTESTGAVAQAYGNS